jgi:alcohol dehydrogenase class IV
MARFELVTSPRIVFGAGALSQLEAIVPSLGSRALLVIGGESADRSGLRERLERLFPVAAIARAAKEPTVAEVDLAVEAARAAGCDVVVAVGGGSVLDCGKAAAGLLSNGGSLLEYLEGVGSGREISRPATPLCAVPTTAGTGSEVTRNAVVSGPGYKKSVRSPYLVPRVALCDPELTRGVPGPVAAACGMDALTQLIEPYLSSAANPICDGLALQGIAAAGRSLRRAVLELDDGAREEMALASLLGGICLANAGLGAVHGLAASLGALFPIPHGVACAAVLTQTIRANLGVAWKSSERERIWTRFSQIAEALTGRRFVDRTTGVDVGLGALHDLQHDLSIPSLRRYGVEAADLPRVVAGARGSSMRYNPVELDDEQLTAILERAL